jgi:hypothetical protein
MLWFDDASGAVTEWITKMTAGNLIGRAVWRIVPGRCHVAKEGQWTRIYWEPEPSPDWLANEELRKREKP